MLKDYSNWCPEIYQGVFIDRFNDKQLKVAPCCAAQTKIENIAEFSFETSPYLTKLRKQFDCGERPVECHQCWDMENVGNASRRLKNLEHFQAPNNNEDQELSLTWIDYSSTWACNLACIMCSPQYSSTWATELNIAKDTLINMGRLYRNDNSIIDKLDLSTINRVHFNGGEPLINDDHIKLLTALDNAKALENTTISYNTNGTVAPNNKTINLWSKSPRVILYFSIDAIGDAYEYIRYPGNWAETSKNLIDIKQASLSNVELGFNITVGSYNIFELDKLEQWILSNVPSNNFDIETKIFWQLAYNFDPKNLSNEAKIAAIEYLKDTTCFTNLAYYLENTIEDRDDKWITELDKIDARRNSNWRKVLTVSKYY